MAGRIPETILEQIKSQTDIVRLVSRYVRLDKKSGQNLTGLCPFHSEKTPSFTVTPTKQIFYCFGCHKGGDAIKFLSEIEHIPWREAAERLAEEAGIQVSFEDDEKYQARRAQKERMTETLLESARFFYRCLSVAEGSGAKRYLLNRGISEVTQRTFGLGLAPDDWDRLALHLKAKGISEQDAIDAGMCQRARNGNIIDVFRNRLMVPIFDMFGNIIAFGGRALGTDKAKYINSKETLLYQKGRHLFALNLARKDKSQPLILVEGYFDAIALHAAGLTSAIAMLGTALSTQQARVLAKLERQILLCLDADPAGQQATVRALATLRAQGTHAQVVILPEFKDPDEYIRKNGVIRFKALLKDTKDEIDFRLGLIHQASRLATGEFDAVAYQRAATGLLAAEENAVLRELKSKQVADALGASEKAVLEEIDRLRNKPTAKPVEVVTVAHKTTVDVGDEVSVLLALADNGKLWRAKGFELAAEDFQEDGFRRYFAAIRESLEKGSFSLFYLQSLVEENNPELANRMLARVTKSGQAPGIAGDVLYRRAVTALKVKRYKRDKDILGALLDETTDEEKRDTLGQLYKEASDQYNTWRQMKI